LTKEKAKLCRYYRDGECTAGPNTCGIVAGRYTTCGDWFPRKKKEDDRRGRIAPGALFGQW
jgi:hypothetical protein